MQRIVFHVGAHRTAPTFVQNSMKRTVALLEEQGIRYLPMAPDFGTTIDVHNPGAADQNLAAEAWRRFGRNISPRSSCLGRQ